LGQIFTPLKRKTGESDERPWGPIAVRLTLRKLASKIASRWAMEYMMPELAPRQLGVGVHGRAEAIVHAAQAFVSEFHRQLDGHLPKE